MQKLGQSSTVKQSTMSALLAEPELRAIVSFGLDLPQRLSGHLEPGQELGRYVVSSQLNSGGFGTIYRGYDPILNREVAIKIQRKTVRSFGLDEARTAALLSHPNVVPVHDVVETDHGSWAMIMPRVEGQSIRPTGDSKQTVSQLTQAALALAHIHSCGYTHHDIKPANVLVDEKGQVFLCDFGLTAQQNTSLQHRAGSPPYMSPEKVSGSAGDTRSDVWSFGVMMYEILAEQRPFHGRNRSELYDAICHATPTPLARLNRKIPRRISRICERCLEKDPASRYATAEELHSDLSSILKSQTRTKWILSTAACLVFALLVFGGWAWSLARRNAIVAVQEFLTIDSVAAHQKLKALPTGRTTDALITRLSEAGETPEVAWRGRLGHSARNEDFQPILANLDSIPASELAFLVNLLEPRAAQHTESLQRLLKSETSRAHAIAVLMMVAPHNPVLHSALEDLRTRAEFLDAPFQSELPERFVVARMLELATGDAPQPIRATALSVLGTFPDTHSVESKENFRKFLSTHQTEIQHLLQTDPSAEIHAHCMKLAALIGVEIDAPPSADADWLHTDNGLSLVRIELAGEKYWVSDTEVLLTNIPAEDRGPTSAHPVGLPLQGKSWFEAIAICNQLSEAEGLIPCYERTEDIEALNSTVNGEVQTSYRNSWKLNLEATGYRLPQLAEWCEICRQDGLDDLSEYQSGRYLNLFANIEADSVDQSRSRLPSRIGLFDTRGNLVEWCWETTVREHVLSHGNANSVVPVSTRAAMGGSHHSSVDQCVPSNPLWLHPESKYPMVGFRVLKRCLAR